MLENMADLFMQQECGYQTCDIRNEYCQKGISAKGSEDSCIPCSSICKLYGSDEYEANRCVEHCPIYAYTQHYKPNTTYTDCEEEFWRKLAFVLIAILVLVFFFCLFGLIKRYGNKCSSLFKLLKRRSADFTSQQEMSHLSAGETLPSDERHDSTVQVDIPHNDSNYFSQQSSPVQEESPEHPTELCIN